MSLKNRLSARNGNRLAGHHDHLKAQEFQSLAHLSGIASGEVQLIEEAGIVGLHDQNSLLPGRRYHERLWTAIATCKKQNRGIYAFLLESLKAKLNNQPALSLLNA